MKNYIVIIVTSILIFALIFDVVPTIANNITATRTQSKVYVDGKPVDVEAYLIEGNNYFKLRDFCEVVDIGVWYEATTGNIYIERDKGYDARYEGKTSADSLRLDNTETIIQENIEKYQYHGISFEHKSSIEVKNILFDEETADYYGYDECLFIYLLGTGNMGEALMQIYPKYGFYLNQEAHYNNFEETHLNMSRYAVVEDIIIKGVNGKKATYGSGTEIFIIYDGYSYLIKYSGRNTNLITEYDKIVDSIQFIRN